MIEVLIAGLLVLVSAGDARKIRKDKYTPVLYMGLRTTDLPNSHIHRAAYTMMNEVYRQFKDEAVKKDIEETQWVYPYEPHITTLYVGNVVPKMGTKEYQAFVGFKEDEVFELEYGAIVYIPYSIVTYVAYINRNDSIYIKNRFPHTTILTYKLSAKYSNDMIEYLYDHYESFRTDYSEMFRNNTSKVLSYPVVIEGDQHTAYVYKLQNIVEKYAFTHRFYSA